MPKARSLDCTFMSVQGLPTPNARDIEMTHSFWRALNPERIENAARSLGLDPPEEYGMETIYLSDFIGKLSFGLPSDPALRGKWLKVLLLSLSAARMAASQVTWLKVEVEGIPLRWDEKRERFLEPHAI
jgi:hypothetical protein